MLKEGFYMSLNAVENIKFPRSRCVGDMFNLRCETLDPFGKMSALQVGELAFSGAIHLCENALVTAS